VPADVPQPTAAAPTNIPAVVVPVPTATDAAPADPNAAAAEPQSVAPVRLATAGGAMPETAPPVPTTPSAAPPLPATGAADAAVTAERQIAPKLDASKKADDAHPELLANASPADAEPTVQGTNGETPHSERPSESQDGAPHKVGSKELDTSAETPKPAHHEVKPETVAQQHDDTAAAKALADPLQPLSLQSHPLRAEGATLPAHAAASPDASAAPSVAVPVSGLAVEIAARAQDGKNRFEIRLDPPDLGRIDVRLDVDRAGNVTSRLVVDRVETLDILRRDAHQLERALEQAGLKTGDNSLQFSLRGQSSPGTDRNNRDGPLPNSAQIVVPDDDLSAVEATRGYGRWFGLGGGVDIRV
jgi:chemotaxis protein MotD